METSLNSYNGLRRYSYCSFLLFPYCSRSKEVIPFGTYPRWVPQIFPFSFSSLFLHKVFDIGMTSLVLNLHKPTLFYLLIPIIQIYWFKKNASKYHPLKCQIKSFSFQFHPPINSWLRKNMYLDHVRTSHLLTVACKNVAFYQSKNFKINKTSL